MYNISQTCDCAAHLKNSLFVIITNKYLHYFNVVPVSELSAVQSTHPLLVNLYGLSRPSDGPFTVELSH